MWMKEYHDIPVARFNEYKTMQTISPIEGHKPIYCIVEAESIVNRHCLLILFHASSCFWLLIKDPKE